MTSKIRFLTAMAGALAALGASTPAVAQIASFASLNGKTGLPVQRFDIDDSHSSVEFAVRFMGLSTVRGAFSGFGGTLMYNPASVERSSISVVIDTKSVDTNNDFRDNDLRSPNFFDAAKYPLITFHSETIARSAKGFVARGPLTMHGGTHPVAIEFRQLHPVSSDAWGNRRVGFLGHLSLSRKAYGILGEKFWNSEFDPGRMSVSDNVDIDLTVSAEVHQLEKWTNPRADSLLAAASTKGSKAVLSDFAAAAADTTSALGKNRDDLLNTLSAKLMHRGQYSDAADAFRLALVFRADNSSALAGLGEASLMLGQRSLAVESFHKAISADSTNTVAYEYLRYLR